jgi:hypothetical protein
MFHGSYFKDCNNGGSGGVAEMPKAFVVYLKNPGSNLAIDIKYFLFSL